MAQVVLTGINKFYDGNVHAVKDVNLDIRDREFMVLVGPSGCGKTTTLRMIAGLEEISSGEIRIGAQRRQRTRADGPRHRHGVPELRALPAHERVRQHGLRPQDAEVRQGGDRASACRTRPRSSASSELLKRKPRQLSGGQRQRVALGRAIVRHPQVFLFDEPLSNLDAKLRVQMRVELKKLHQRLGTTAIYVTHDQVEAMTLGDRVVVMKDGVVQQVGEPLELYNAPATTVRRRLPRLAGDELRERHGERARRRAAAASARGSTSRCRRPRRSGCGPTSAAR